MSIKIIFYLQNLKNITFTENRIDNHFLTTIDKLNEIKTKVEFSQLWDKLCFDIKAGSEDVSKSFLFIHQLIFYFSSAAHWLLKIKIQFQVGGRALSL